MEVAQLITVVLILCVAFPRSIQPKRKSKPKKFCVGKDGNRYKLGEGYEDEKEKVCIHYKCAKNKNKSKFIMKKGKCGEAIMDTCDDAGCKKAFNGLGMCMDTSNADWVNMSKIIDFSAGTKAGKCSSDCNCNCFKHIGCFSNNCDNLKGICLIPDQEEKRGFFIPDEYEKAFPCDESLDCHCFIKNYDGVTRPSAAATESPTYPPCPSPPVCPTILPTSPSSACLDGPSTSSPSIAETSTYPSISEGSSENTSAANSSTIQGCSSDGQRLNVSTTVASIITSSGYPQINYSDNTFCDWTFQAPPGQKISFILLELETEFGYDVLKLYDGAGGEEEKEQILATMSGTTIHDAVKSSKEQMRVIFTTDISNNMRGFKASVSAFNKEDLPKFDWIDEKNINVAFPNGKGETISLKLFSNVRRSCVFHGKTVNTSLTISSSSTNSGCRSLTEDVEISITSNNLKGNFGLFSLKNGKLKNIDETVFVSNSLNREVSQLSKRTTGITLPKRIQIPVNFGFDRGLLEKLTGKYGLGRNFIERRIEEVFAHGKLLLQGISNNMIIDLIFKSDIVFIDSILVMNHQDLRKSRQFQVDEQTPLIILIDDDYANNIKGLSFRSGACRNDKKPNGVTMVAWDFHSTFMGDVVYHEMGHMLGGIHDGGKSEHHSGLHLGHSEFNSQNVNNWFISAGHRCYGKTCSSPPPSPSHGNWTCDNIFTNCQLICTPGYTPVNSNTNCVNGQWDTTSSHICFFLSSNTVFLLAGGIDAERSVELYHPTLGTPSCRDPPPQLPQDRYRHTTFYHHSTIYNCGGSTTESTCLIFVRGASSWTSHSLPSPIGERVVSVVIKDNVYFIGGRYERGGWQYPTPTYTTLPLTTNSTLTPVPNLTYKGHNLCVAQLSTTSFIISGGKYHDEYLSKVTKYNVEDKKISSLASLPSPPRFSHGCLVIEEDGKEWLIVTGGWIEGTATAVTQRLDIQANTWEELGNLRQTRYGHAMVNSDRGVLVMAGGSSWPVGNVNNLEILVKKEWQKIEPSISRGRVYSGPAVKVPANLFSCQLDLHPGLRCPALNINTPDREDETILTDILTMEQCSIECLKNIKCEFWTWINEDGGHNSFNCILMSRYLSTLSDFSSITADRKCDLGCPTPPPRDHGNWTCNEVNTNCSLNCDPGFVTLYTEIECSGGEWKDVGRINCWRKNQPVVVEGCSGEYLYDEEFPGGEIVTVQHDETCHGVCEGRQDCVSWTWTNTTGCRLQTSLGTNQTNNGSISGLQNSCRPLCYLVVGKGDEATTNIQYCYESNQTTNCQDIIQREASQFTDEDEILVCYQKGDILCESINFEDVGLLCNPEPGITTLSVHQYINKHRFTRNLGPHFKYWGKPYGRK